MKEAASTDLEHGGFSQLHELRLMGDISNYHEWVFDMFKPFISGKVVEVGAGNGNFTAMLLTDGVDRIDVVEPDGTIFKSLQAALGDNEKIFFHQGYAEEVLAKLPYAPDVIFYINVLEHIEDDEKELLLCHKALKQNGKLCVFVPAMPCLMSRFDRAAGHHRRYGKRDFTELCRKTGFHVLKLRYFDAVGAFGWFVRFRLFGSMGQNASQVRFYDSFIVPISEAVEKIVSPPFGKNIVLVAEKR